MHWLASSIRRFLGNTRNTPIQKRSRPRWRPYLESLEDRLTPAAAGFQSTAGSVLSGLVYIDTNNNNVRDAGEMAAQGVSVVLNGTTDAGGTVAATAVTDAAGAFTFFQLAPGTYSLTRGGGQFVAGLVQAGNLGGTNGLNDISQIRVNEGQTGINFNLAVRGLASPSLRGFLSNATFASFGFSGPGAGFTAADRTVQPSTTAAAGTASLEGFVYSDINPANGVKDGAESGIASVQIGLTGIDDTGRAISRTTTTDGTGKYEFTALRPGVYSLNVLGQPAGFRAGTPTIGSLGGVVFRNDQITGIRVAAAADGNDYNFGEIIGPALAGGDLAASLANDTAGAGAPAGDNITSDPSVQGIVSNAVVSLRAGFGGNLVDILSHVGPGGRFFLNAALIRQLAGGAMPDGDYVLNIQAVNNLGAVTNLPIAFTLDTTAPANTTPIGLSAATDTDPDGDGGTQEAIVTLQGTTTANTRVELFSSAGVLLNTTDTADGNYVFNNVNLAVGPNDFVVRFTDAAGNKREARAVFVRNRAPEGDIADITRAATAANEVINLAGLFNDADLSNTVVRFNTTAGVIDIELLDGQARRTVVNFLNYLQAGRYDDTIFHRLATNFVLQGGGFTFETNPNDLDDVTPFPTVDNEFDNANRPNVVGTLAMAKLGADLPGGGPNSATSQWFFNLVDNTNTLGSSNNGGFTVFGRIRGGADQRILNTLAAFSVRNESDFNGAFNTFPMRDYVGDNFPLDAVKENFALVDSIEILRQSEELKYEVISVTGANPGAVEATIPASTEPLNNLLTLDFKTAGTATVNVRVTDKYGASVNVSFDVTVTA